MRPSTSTPSSVVVGGASHVMGGASHVMGGVGGGDTHMAPDDNFSIGVEAEVFQAPVSNPGRTYDKTL